MYKLPKYTRNKMKGNIGEAFVQYILSKFCLVHKIDGSNDIGNDSICELIKNEYPTNLLFYVQVKHTERKPSVRKETLKYWKDSPIPVYLFWVKGKNTSLNYKVESIEKYIKYKRFTPIVHKSRHKDEDFKEYSEIKFKKDLLIDYARCQYYRGFTPIIKPKDFLVSNSNEFIVPEDVFYIKDVIPEYKNEILDKSWVNLFTVAVLLYREGEKDKNTLEMALKAIDLADLLRRKSNDPVTLIFNNLFKRHKANIKKELERL